MIFYSSTPARSFGVATNLNVNATAKFLMHSAQVMELKTMSKSTTDFTKRCSIEAEIRIGEKKIAYWERHPNFNLDDAIKGQRAIRQAMNWKQAA